MGYKLKLGKIISTGTTVPKKPTLITTVIQDRHSYKSRRQNKWKKKLN